MKQLLNFNEEGMKGLHFFTKTYFPIAIASYSDWEEQQLSYLENNFQPKRHTTWSLCKWCIYHHIQYEILYPTDIQNILRNPYRFVKYLQFKKNLKVLSKEKSC